MEQADHVACGQSELANQELHFYRTVEECVELERPNLLLLSGVLQCLPQPYVMLESLLRLGLEHVIVDRVAFLNRDEDRLTIQTVPETIYPASYPSWFLSESRFRAMFRDTGYTIVADFPGFDVLAPVDERAHYKGFICGKDVTPDLLHLDTVKQRTQDV